MDSKGVNDTPATAASFGRTNTVSQPGLTLHSSADVGAYRFTVPGAGTFVLTVAPTAGAGTLSLALLDAQGAALAPAQPATGGGSLTVKLQAGVAYSVRVSSPTGSVLTYSRA